MNKKIIDQFDINFYYWSLNDFQREMGEKYHLLKSINNIILNHLIEILEKKPIEEQKFIGESLIKKQNKKALELLGIELTQDNLNSIDLFYKEFTRFSLYEYPAKKFNKSRLIFKSGKIINKAIEKEFENVEGVTVSDSGSGIFLTTLYNKFYIKTGINIPKKGREFAYAHAIYNGDLDECNMIKYSISITSWMGLGMAKWELLENEDVTIAVKSFKIIYQHFINSFPEIIVNI